MKVADDLLAESRIAVSPETFHVVSLSPEDWKAALARPELSPDPDSGFLLFKDRWEVTLILEDSDFQRLAAEMGNLRRESGFRLLSFDCELEFDVVGFMARVTGIAAEAGISILAASSFARDHLFVRQEDLAGLLGALRGHVKEVC